MDDSEQLTDQPADGRAAELPADAKREALCDELVRNIAAQEINEQNKLVSDCLDRIMLGLGWKKSEKADDDGVVIVTYAENATKETYMERVIKAHCASLVDIVERGSKGSRFALTEIVLQTLMDGLGWKRTVKADSESDSAANEPNYH